MWQPQPDPSILMIYIYISIQLTLLPTYLSYALANWLQEKFRV